MKWWKIFINWIRSFFKMTKLPIIEATGLIDESKVKNVCLCYDGKELYFTAIVNGIFIYIKHSFNLENWFKKSNIPISRLCDIWEMEIPDDENIIEMENIPVSVKKSKLNNG